jgi:superfamily II DNA or RNA helicase/diadenosine tetraphosphate (Ap4A) HIT family hydrolase
MSNPGCPFCSPPAEGLFYQGGLTYGLWDRFPVSDGHALLIPKRHVPSWFEATREEQTELTAAIETVKARIEERLERNPDGFTVGMNLGEAAGQTVPHLHVHVIPRFVGDVNNPVGGVRNVIPARADYTLGKIPHGRVLITGGADDPLLPHLAEHLVKATRFDFAVAFLRRSGLRMVLPMIEDFLARGGHLRAVTGTYLNITEPHALRVFLDFSECYPNQVVFRVFDAPLESFHPKAYLFYGERGTEGSHVALVGSSNLSESALTTGNEWNYRAVAATEENSVFADVREAFERLLEHSKVRTIDAAWIDSYETERKPTDPPGPIVPPEPPADAPTPTPVQEEALEALEATRQRGNTAGLVVLATGLGKTWLSAFDVKALQVSRVLFVAHREEILRQAMTTFRQLRPSARLGMYGGGSRDSTADVIFASIQTLGRQAHLDRFRRDEFEYVVVDEFHHASARTYRRLIDYFDPKFLLGLTATPDRSDGADLLALCQHNVVYQCDLTVGIQRELLAPFEYFGVPDDVDYEQIPWRSSRFDEEALTEQLATRKRAQNALEQFQEKGGSRALGFCCSTRHANFMREFFLGEGVRAAAVHSASGSSDDRQASLDQLQRGDLEILFSVDMFNEGVDLPEVDTVMMLRPTESQILWLQQFGRGLRRRKDKKLRVIDYIGNHRTFLVKVQTLYQLPANDGAVAQALDRYEGGDLPLPPGCSVTYDLKTIEILRSLLRISQDVETIRFYYQDYRERYDQRPTASQMYHAGYPPHGLRSAFGSWFGFVRQMGDLTETEAQCLDEPGAGGFLRALETTAMTKSYKMLVLLAMLREGRFPGSMPVDDLTEAVGQLAARSAMLQADLGVSLSDREALKQKLIENPIRAWTGGKGTGGAAYFVYRNDEFQTTFKVTGQDEDAFARLVRELADWRLDSYLDRPQVNPTEGVFDCRVIQTNGRPILKLPERDKYPEIPEGWVRITVVEDEATHYEMSFQKVAVNVMRRPEGDSNVLGEVLRQWFGEDAGQPGTKYQVRFSRTEDGWLCGPRERTSGLVVGDSYMREEIPPAYGLTFSTGSWNQGYIRKDGHLFLLVTLDKEGQQSEHQYEDQFLSAERFQWQSQNKQSRSSPSAEVIRDHGNENVDVHLFVRRQKKMRGKAAPFIYCGDVEFIDWEGDAPITVRWRLMNPLTDELWKLFVI